MIHIFESICATKNRSQWTRKQCAGLTFYPKELFYPIPWTNYTMYFDTENLHETVKRMEKSTLIHVWNDKSRTIWHRIGTKNAYQFAAKHNCPHVYSASEYLWKAQCWSIALTYIYDKMEIIAFQSKILTSIFLFCKISINILCSNDWNIVVELFFSHLNKTHWTELFDWNWISNWYRENFQLFLVKTIKNWISPYFSQVKYFINSNN